MVNKLLCSVLDEGLFAAAKRRDLVKMMSGVVSGPPALVKELILFFLLTFLLLAKAAAFFFNGAGGAAFVDRVEGIDGGWGDLSLLVSKRQDGTNDDDECK